MTNESEFKQIVARNLTKFRKANGLTQLELADKLNYSDKAVSKWERGESLPDVYMLKIIADMFGITLNDLISEETLAFKKKSKFNHIVIIMMSVGLTWLIAAALAITMITLEHERPWLIFLYAIPASGIVSIVLTKVWNYRKLLFISISSLYYSIPLAFCATINWTNKVALTFIISGILQLLTILWYFRKLKAD